MSFFKSIVTKLNVRPLMTKRMFTFTSYRLARFQNRQIREKLKNVMVKNMEAKEFYRQKDYVILRPPGHLWRAGAFFLGTGLIAYTCASITQYYNARRHFQTLMEQTVAEIKRIYFGYHQTSPIGREIGPVINWIVGINVMVFLLWRIPKLQPFMTRYFASGFASKSLCLPMLSSVFSHSYTFHLLANMYVMYSFSQPVAGFLGKEQFLAFYLTGGVFSSLISLIWKCLTRSTIPSVGASGAISAMIGYFCIMVPNAQLSLIFIPGWHFSSQDALYGMLLFELTLMLVGFFTRFRFFDNGAHIGGLLFGMWYAQRGEEYYRRHFMPTVINYMSLLGIRPKKETPIVVYDGKKHVKTTLEKMHEEEFEKEKRNQKMEADAKRAFQLERKRLWNEYQQEQANKQKQRKLQILEQRKRKQIDDEYGGREDGEKKDENNDDSDE